MNPNITVRKFVIDDKNTRVNLSEQERVKFLTTIGRIVIQILEIEADNPSDLILVVTTESSGAKRETPVYLFSYRDKMLFQNNKYIVRLDYVLNTVGTHFDIEVISESKQAFKLTAYYSAH